VDRGARPSSVCQTRAPVAPIQPESPLQAAATSLTVAEADTKEPMAGLSATAHLSNASSQHLLMICTEYCPETTSQRHTSLHPGPVSVNSLQTGEVWTKVHRSITLQTCSVPTPRNFCNRCEFDAALTALIGAQSNNLLPFTPSTLLIADIRQQALALATFERVLQRLSSGRFRPTPAWSSASRPPPIR
jgi:hypothetical protein